MPITQQSPQSVDSLHCRLLCFSQVAKLQAFRRHVYEGNDKIDACVAASLADRAVYLGGVVQSLCRVFSFIVYLVRTLLFLPRLAASDAITVLDVLRFFVFEGNLPLAYCLHCLHVES